MPGALCVCARAGSSVLAVAGMTITHSGCVAGLLQWGCESCSSKVWHPQNRLTKHSLFCSCNGNPWRAARRWPLCFSPTASFCAALGLHGSNNCFEHKKHNPKAAWLGLSSQRSLLPAALHRAALGRGVSTAWSCLGSLWCLSLWALSLAKCSCGV